MSKNIIQIIVIILGLLIIFAFLAIIYGMYLKISISKKNLSDSVFIFSSQLSKGEKINNINVIDKNRLIILIESNQNIKGAIYDINKNQIIGYIDR